MNKESYRLVDFKGFKDEVVAYIGLARWEKEFSPFCHDGMMINVSKGTTNYGFTVTPSEIKRYFVPVVYETKIIPDNNVDALETHPEPVEEQTDIDLQQSRPIAPSVGGNVPEAVTSCPIEQIKQLCSDHNVNIEISNKGEIYIHIENIDNTYKVCDMKQLTQVLDSVKLLESFKED